MKLGGVGILDGTPPLDIKPCMPEFDAFSQSQPGWLRNRRDTRNVADRGAEASEQRTPSLGSNTGQLKTWETNDCRVLAACLEDQPFLQW